MITRDARSRIEVAVVLLGVLIALAVAGPTLLSSREQARRVQCIDHLRGYGRAFVAFSEDDAEARLCSGAYDWLQDGCPTRYGWVADVVSTGGSPQLSRCPANALAAGATVATLVGQPGVPTPVRTVPDVLLRIMQGECSDFAIDTDGDGVADEGAWSGASDERLAAVADMLEEGYGTNYTPSWYFVRTSFRVVPGEGGMLVSDPDWPLTSRPGSLGPLSIEQIEKSSILAANIPLLADGAAAWGDDATPAVDLPAAGLTAGRPLAATMGDGIVCWEPELARFEPLPPGTPVLSYNPDEDEETAFAGEYLPTPAEAGQGGSDGKLWMLDTRGWGAFHLEGRRTVCNFLMADGSVKSMPDLNGDGALNPGFAVKQPGQTVFADATCELPPWEVYCGPDIVHRSMRPDIFE
ncbi:H-X9-DG-CTERM domain-containing protein [Maioricimonas sp. JC845]|uniref:type II secretion system protein n=1 Tax=Maioricimonas sp. JC845 TaxID=3232138 RepID=UPI0034578CD4